ncbi:MAG: flagellar M-ring protein FliF [Lachnospiraceae bacterium]|nr:flagellar M-ring protein FliF [Lachnospiraceae bacterium]
MIGKLKEIWEKIVAWWNKFTSKQRTLIIVLAAVVVIAFVILYAVLTSPNYTMLEQCKSTKEASQITTVLEGAEIPYKVTDDGLQVKVPKKNLSQARLTLAGSGIVTSGYTIDEALSGSFTVTEADKSKKYKLYLESTFEEDFVNVFPAINSCTVQLSLPENDGTLLSKDEEPGATIYLNIAEGEEFTTDNAASLAKAVATALGCKNANNIVIMDSDANLLYSGEDISSAAGNASTQLGVKADAENLLNQGVKKVIGGFGPFGDVKVASNLVIDFSTTEKTSHEYKPADGQSQGLYSERSSYTEESQGGGGGVPGTDSNSETTQYYQDNSYSNSTIEELYEKYLPNEFIENTQIPAGTVKYSESSVAVSSTNFIIVKEDDVKKQGLLDGITWEEYKAANSERTPITVTDEMIALVSRASGIPERNIQIVAYDENFFVDSEGLGIDIYDVIQIALIVIILALLGIVVIRSMRGDKSSEEPEELSVETLLQSNPEPTLDDIEIEESSETKRLIEKFVDENPEAVANLLRNWLNEGWE